MPRYGFHGEITEIKFVLLYTLKNTLWRPSRDELVELAFIDDNMDYFQFSDALVSLVDGRQAVVSEDGRYSLTEEGIENEGVIENDIPAALRRAIDEEVEPKNNAFRRESCIHAETVIRNTRYYAFLTLTDGRIPIYKLEVLSASEEHANALCKSFKKQAEVMYQQIMQTLG